MKKLLYPILLLLLAVNILAYNHAYHFTHFADSHSEKTKKPEELSVLEKAAVLFTGASVPKPLNKKTPAAPFETIYFDSHETLEGWLVAVENHRGVVIMFHGYANCKASLLGYSDEFNALGYSTFLVDLTGSGGSAGRSTTLGYREGRDVTEAFRRMKQRFPGDKIVLFGVSMGAAAITKAVDEFRISPDAIILESPFASLRTAVRQRFAMMNIPSFPFADLLLFYGGMQSGFDAYSHRPAEYAASISQPTLLLYGAKDRRVTREETEQIFVSLTGKKQLKIFENAGHEVFLKMHRAEWIAVVGEFLSRN